MKFKNVFLFLGVFFAIGVGCVHAHADDTPLTMPAATTKTELSAQNSCDALTAGDKEIVAILEKLLISKGANYNVNSWNILKKIDKYVTWKEDRVYMDAVGYHRVAQTKTGNTIAVLGPRSGPFWLFVKKGVGANSINTFLSCANFRLTFLNQETGSSWLVQHSQYENVIVTEDPHFASICLTTGEKSLATCSYDRFKKKLDSLINTNK